MTQLLHAPAGAAPFPRSLVDRDRDRLARYREFLDYFDNSRTGAFSDSRTAQVVSGCRRTAAEASAITP